MMYNYHGAAIKLNFIGTVVLPYHCHLLIYVMYLAASTRAI